MNTEDIKSMAAAWAQVQEAAKKKMDPVGKADADIDNDGDVDKSDEYLHNRRKAISKNIKKKDKAEVTMNAKVSDNKMGQEEQKESTDWPIYKKIMEKRDMHYRKAAPADPQDIGQSPGGKKMKADVMQGAEMDDTEEKGHTDVRKAGIVTKVAPKRNGDRTEGDKNVINPPEDATKKGGMTA